jgi:general secretion pathway protein J
MRQTTPKGGGGFTLLELLISLTILSLMIVLVLGAFRIGVRAWERGETDVEGRQRYRIVFDRVKGQLASISSRPLTADGEPYYLQGTPDALSFASDLPLNPGNALGTALVGYRVDPNGTGDQWRLFEKQALFADSGEDEPLDWADADPGGGGLFGYPLLSDAGEISFAYLGWGDDDGPPEWTAFWNGPEIEAFPQAVRIDFYPNDGSGRIRVIARTHAEPPAEK